jgi:hypothetical protein
MLEMKEEFQKNLNEMRDNMKNDGTTITTMMEKIEKLDKAFEQQLTDQTKTDLIMNQRIQQTVQKEIEQHINELDNKLHNKLTEAFLAIDSKNDNRFTQLVQEQQELKQEFRNTSATTQRQFDQIMAMFTQQQTMASTQDKNTTMSDSPTQQDPPRNTLRVLNTRTTRHTAQSNMSNFDSGAIKSCLNKLQHLNE